MLTNSLLLTKTFICPIHAVSFLDAIQRGWNLNKVRFSCLLENIAHAFPGIPGDPGKEKKSMH